MKSIGPFLAQAGGDLATMLVVLLVIILFLGIGLAKCWAISRRPTTNAKCVMALALLLTGCLVTYLGGIAALFIPPALDDLITIISIAIILSSAVLAVVGLREYARHPGTYKQGRAQAIWTLALSGFVVAYPIFLLAQARWNILHKDTTAAAARVMMFDNLNFKFFVPGDPWQELDGDPLDLKPTLVLRCKGSEVHFAVVAQPAGPTYKYSADQLETLATNTLSNTLENIRVLSRVPIRRQYLEGLQLDIEAGHRGQMLYVENRLFKFNDLTYQLITWGPKRHEETVMAFAPRLLFRFELLDYTPKGNPYADLPNVWIKP